MEHPKYRPDIDGLRAIAVLAVVFFHAFPNWIPGGFVGVDIFFVISGFLISTIILGNLETKGFRYREFYTRRINRLGPALLLVLTSCYGWGWFNLLANEFSQLGKHLAGGAGFVSNLVLWNEVGYFDSAADTKPLLHLWSLGIEEQFYLFWPLLLVWIWRRKTYFFPVMISVTALSFFANLYLIWVSPTDVFYSPLTRFWELMVGGILAYLQVHAPKRLAFQAQCQSILGLILILAGIGLIRQEYAFPGYWALLPVLGTLLLISAGPQALINRLGLSRKGMVWVGLISYPLYLWHWPILSFGRIANGGTPSPWLRLLAIGISLGLAYLTYRWVEKPLRACKRPMVSACVLFSLVLLVVGIGFMTWTQNGFPWRQADRQWAEVAQDLKYTYDKPFHYLHCALPFQDPHLVLNYCYRSAATPATMAVMGDSHAEDKFHGLVKKAPQYSWLLFANDSCPPLLGVQIEGQAQHCEARTEGMVSALQREPAVKAVVLFFAGYYLLEQAYAADHIVHHFELSTLKMSSPFLTSHEKPVLFAYGLEKTVTQLEKSGKQVILAIDIPELPFFPRDCIRKPNSPDCSQSRQAVLTRQGPLRSLLGQLSSRHPKLKVYDPLDLFCDAQSCTFRNQHMLYYRDSHHLSLRGSEMYAEHFLNWLRQNP